MSTPEYLLTKAVQRSAVPASAENNIRVDAVPAEASGFVHAARKVLRRMSPRAIWSDKRGGVAIIMAVAAVPLIGVSALAVDVGIWEVNKSRMQGAADQAVLAAGVVMSSGITAARNEAKGVAAANGFVEAPGGVTVTLAPPTTGPYAGVGGALEVVITQPQTTFLSGVILNSAPIASARAVVAPSAASTCLMALSLSGQGIKAQNTARVISESCNIYVNSNENCPVEISNSSTVRGFNVFLRKPAGSSCVTNSSTLSAASPPVHTNAGVATDPYLTRAIPLPSGACPSYARSGTGTYSLTPGCYSKIEIDLSVTLNLSPGVYVIDNGGVSISNSSSINGTGVTLVLTGNSASTYKGLTIQNSSILNLEAMRTGPTRGIAVWIDKKQPAEFKSINSSRVNVTGAIYAAGANVQWANSSGATSECLQLIVNTVEFANSATFKHNCSGLGVEDVASLEGYRLRE